MIIIRELKTIMYYFNNNENVYKVNQTFYNNGKIFENKLISGDTALAPGTYIKS